LWRCAQNLQASAEEAVTATIINIKKARTTTPATTRQKDDNNTNNRNDNNTNNRKDINNISNSDSNNTTQ
jgi:hypothetical protein